MTAKPTASTSATGQLSSASGKAGGDQHRAQIERVAGVGVGAGHRQFAILFHVAGRVGAQPEAGQHQHQAPGHGGRQGRAPPSSKR
jgi:hypothetical protein